MADLRLGDEIDDYCIKCRRLTNHVIVSLVEGTAAKVRCRSCFNDHDYRHEQIPPSKRELAKRKELFNAVLSNAVPPGLAAEALPAEADPPVPAPASSPKKKKA